MEIVIQVFVIVAIGLSSVTSFNAGDILPEGRISNGKDAEKNQFPYMVGIRAKNKNGEIFRCGGSLIGNKWVLTAAHCLEGAKKATLSLGGVFIDEPAVQHIVRSKKFILHPDFGSTTFQNDIALIRIPFTKYRVNIQPVRLPSFANQQLTYEGVITHSPGFGRISFHGNNMAQRLLWAEFEVISNSLCAETYGSQVTASHICTATDNGHSACIGDSGGPLVLTSTNTQIGIHSFTRNLGCPIPNVSTRVSSYLEWIKHHTKISY